MTLVSTRRLLGLSVARASGAYVSGTPSGVKMTVASAAPASPATGDVWVDTSATVGSGCRASKSGSQSLVTATHTAITLEGEDYDDASYHDNVTNNTRMTIPVTGRYRITGCVEFNTNATGGRQAVIWKNGTGTGTRLAAISVAPASTFQTRPLVATGPVNLVAGDYIELGGYQDSGGALTVTAGNGSASTWLAIERVS